MAATTPSNALPGLLMAFENAGTGMALANRSGELLQVNRSLAGWLGYQSDELLGTSLHRLAHPEDVPNSQILVEQWLHGKVGERPLECRFLTKAGAVVWARLLLSRVPGPDDPSFRLLIQLQDITQQRQDEEDLRWKTAFFEAQANSTAEGVLVVDGKGKRILVNPRFTEMLKVPQRVLDDKNEEALIQYCTGLANNPELFLEKFDYLSHHPSQTSQDEIEFADGMALDRHSSPVIGKDGKHYGRIWTFRDITERRRTEDALHLLSSAVEQSPVSVVITDPKGRITYVNRKFMQWTGYKLEEILGKNPRILKSGHTSAEEYRSMWKTLTQGAEWHGEFRNRKKNGELYWESAAITPIKDGSGRITHFLAIKEDTTERKIIDSQLKQARKLEAIGQLTAGIAHEINTPMQYVGDNVTFLKETWAGIGQLLSAARQLHREGAGGALSEGSFRQFAACCQAVDIEFLEGEIPRALEQALEGIERVKVIVRAMKEFSHPGAEGNGLVDLNKAIETTITVTRNEWKYVAEMETHFAADLPPVPCQAGPLNQVILNLIVNAVDAIRQALGEGSEAKGKITITTRRQGDWAEISIRDTGTGIPEQVQPRMFEYFFTTKPVGKGTGQGLALARNTIEKKHNGKIWFETEVGKGTAFFIHLPLAAAAGASAGT
jgi:PAS domain S-box-containing protein